MTVPRRGRAPDPEVDAAIRDAVIDLLFERGFEMTFDEVAARASVGRATVFRRFPTKRDMILRAMAQVSFDRVEVPDTGSLRGDLVALVASVMAVLGESRTRTLARHFHAEACRDAAFAGLLRTHLDRRLERVASVFARGIHRGELPATTDTGLLADLVSGMVALRLATDAPLPTHAEIARMVDGLLHGFARTERTGPPPS
jgi:AcrR family transcriptional regulator